MMQTKKSLIRYYAPALVGLLIIIVLLALPTGFESGMTIRTNTPIYEQPSTYAASSISFGMERKKFIISSAQ